MYLIFIAIWSTHRTLLFYIVSSIAEAVIVAGHHGFYPLRCRKIPQLLCVDVLIVRSFEVKNTKQIFQLEFFLFWRWSVPPLQGLLFQFRGCVRHPCLICHLLITALPLHFVLFRKLLRHAASIHFRQFSFSDIISWRCERKIFGKYRESNSLTFSSTVRTKSSFTKVRHPFINVTKFMVNFNRFNVPRIQETDHKPNFTFA